MKIRTKLTLAFLSCGLAPVVIAAVVGYTAARNSLSAVGARATDDMRAKATAFLQSQQSLKKAQIEGYFEQIRDQMLTFAENHMVIDSMTAFAEHFKAYREQREVSDEQIDKLRNELATYYTGEFSAEYSSQNSGAKLDVDALLNKLDDDSVLLQHAYIRANQHPLGSKHLLDSSDTDTAYGWAHAQVHPIIRNFLDKFGYYDIFLIDNESGDIVYSVFKELDYSTSLIDGPYAESNFGRAFRQAKELGKGEFAFVDFEQYTPSYEAPASFIASPIFQDEKRVGVAIFQMPVDRILQVMSRREGLGETGETLLVGTDHQMRCDSFLEPETHSLTNSFRNPATGRITTAGVEQALEGNSGVSIQTDYRGQETLNAYGPVDLLGVRWALQAKMDTAEAFAADNLIRETADAATTGLLWLNIGVLALATVAVLAIAWLITQSLVKPLRALVDRAQGIAQGEADLTQRLEVKSQDEIGELAGWFNQFIERMQQMIVSVANNSQSLAGAADQLNNTATILANGASGTTEKSATVASAAEEMSINMGQVSESTSQMSESIRTVASSTEQMNETITEIAKNAEESAKVADEASRLAAISNEKVGGLGDAADEIGKVIEVIQDIAEQTNLLALNATIEAARAGDAGKGFAVVATEVKELAKQTATATDDIRNRIEGIQGSSGEAVTAIQEITEVINNVNNVSRTIAAAVEEQSITTKGIASTVAESSSSADVVAQGVSESAIASQEITKHITGVDQGAKETAGAASDTKTAGASVANLAGELQTLVSQFRY